MLTDISVGAAGQPRRTYYYKDKQTGSRKSLKTRDPEEADLLIQHKNLTSHGSQTAQINRQIGMAYLSGPDPALTERVWQDVMGMSPMSPRRRIGIASPVWKTGVEGSRPA